MRETIVKILGIKMKNFKNVKRSEISFVDKNELLNLIGIYGQNGSSKTAVIECINILKTLLSEETLQKDLFYFINADSNYFQIDYSLFVKHKEEEYDVNYIIKVKRLEEHKTKIVKETLEIRSQNDKEIKAKIEFKEIKNNYEFYIYDSKISNEENNGIIEKSLATAAAEISNQLSKSIIFQQFLLNGIKKSGLIKNVINALRHYSIVNLFVVGTKETSLISAIDSITLNVRTFNNPDLLAFGKFPLNLFETIKMSKDLLQSIQPTICQINQVMSKIIPGFKLGYKEFGEELNEKNVVMNTIQFTSKLNDKEIPLKYESEGIKKLISLCSAMIAMHNDESVCLVVDEFDSGVFEFLLGSLVKILQKSGKGQLIFTSHNLRLLETLPKKCIVFSTTNPNKRYIKMSNVKPNNNLRDLYLRTLLVGGQKEELYSETDEFEIERAFRKCQI